MAKTRTIVRYRSRAKAHHKRAGMTLPVAALAGFVPLASNGVRDFQQGGLDLLGTGLVWRLTGYNRLSGKFDASGLMTGLVPIILGVGAHKLASKFGINRALAQAGVPLLRI